MRGLDRRVGALEQLPRPLPADQAELWRSIPRHLTFEEIVAGQQALERYRGDPVRALEADDQLFGALVAIARARRQGP